MRVSDNTSAGAVHESLGRTRGKMERLQIQNSTQKKLLTPSDDPAANAKIMNIRTETTVNKQFENNAAIAKNRLQVTDVALNELYDLFVRAKEIAVGQSSDASASQASRLGVAQEVTALYNQLVSIANRRVGHHYLFSGFKTLTSPYSREGQYAGDSGEIPVEIQKDVFISMNVPGEQVFKVSTYRDEDVARAPATDRARSPQGKDQKGEFGDPALPKETINLFHELDALRIGLLTNDTITVRDTLERFDDIITNIVGLRTKVSSRVSGIDAAIGATERSDLQNAELATHLEDADYTELWSNLAKEETAYRSSLHAAQKLIQPTLLDFLR